MSGPNPPGPDSEGSDSPEQEPGDQAAEDDGCDGRDRYPLAGVFGARVRAVHQRPVRAADPGLYDYDDYDAATELVEPRPPRWPWVVGVVAIIAGGLPGRVGVVAGDRDRHRQPRDAGNEHDDIGAAGAGRDHHHDPASAAPAAAAREEPPPPPPETVTVTQEPPPAAAAARGSAAAAAGRDAHRGGAAADHDAVGSAPGDLLGDRDEGAGRHHHGHLCRRSGRSRTQRNVYIPWSLTVTPISQSEVGSVQASSLFLVSRLNCSITTSDGTVLSSNTGNSAQTSC